MLVSLRFILLSSLSIGLLNLWSYTPFATPSQISSRIAILSTTTQTFGGISYQRAVDGQYIVAYSASANSYFIYDDNSKPITYDRWFYISNGDKNAYIAINYTPINNMINSPTAPVNTSIYISYDGNSYEGTLHNIPIDIQGRTNNAVLAFTMDNSASGTLTYNPKEDTISLTFN